MRNEGQHAYIDIDPGAIYDAAERQDDQGRKIAARLATWIDGFRAQA